MVTSQLTMRTKKRSSLAAFSRTTASMAGEGSMFRKLICKGICMLFSFSILKPMSTAVTSQSRSRLSRLPHRKHTSRPIQALDEGQQEREQGGKETEYYWPRATLLATIRLPKSPKERRIKKG